ncbi:MAG: hypothetical protein A4E55_02268 [Pelotomaculum sp. PtaU1.Bin035]|nr:MAG: hypothetical protein A4E55_02268 [Pelotomaculum sp. PtaU1.Bin035]
MARTRGRLKKDRPLSAFLPRKICYKRSAINGGGDLQANKAGTSYPPIGNDVTQGRTVDAGRIV